MENEKMIEVLNKLIVINNDRIEGYETASKETEASDLKTLFSEFIRTSKNCKTELFEEVNRLEGIPDEGTRITGKFFRVWMDVKSALTGNNREVVLSSCEFGEDAALQAYKMVLDNNSEDLTSDQLTMVVEQKLHIKADHDKVKELRDKEKASKKQ